MPTDMARIYIREVHTDKLCEISGSHMCIIIRLKLSVSESASFV